MQEAVVDLMRLFGSATVPDRNTNDREDCHAESGGDGRRRRRVAVAGPGRRARRSRPADPRRRNRQSHHGNRGLCAGYIRKVLVKAGDTVAIGADLAIIADSLDEPLEDARAMRKHRRPSPVLRQPDSAAPPSSPFPPKTRRIQASPLARRLAKERGIDLATVKASGPIHKRDILAVAIPRSTGGEHRSELLPMPGLSPRGHSRARRKLRTSTSRPAST